MNFEKTTQLILEKIKELHLPYFSIIVKKNEEEIFKYKYLGDDNRELLCMYSMSKPITSVALMQLVKKGLISLDDNVSDYIDGFDNLYNMKTGEKYHSPMKIYHLLTMTSGLDYNFERASIKELAGVNPNASTIEVCSKAAKDGLLFEPGSSYQYSLSLDVIGAIVEKVSGIRFSKYIKENIFDPLNMNESTFEYRPDLLDKCRDDYYPNEDRSDIYKSNHAYFKFFPTKNFESGGAGLIGTVEDYSKFADAVANEKLLDKERLNEISKLRVKETPFNEDVCEYSKSSIDYGYGLAVRIRKVDSPEGIPAGEFGWDGAAGSYCLMDRKNKISIVIGLTVLNWPVYVKDLHLKLVKTIYQELSLL